MRMKIVDAVGKLLPMKVTANVIGKIDQTAQNYTNSLHK